MFGNQFTWPTDNLTTLNFILQPYHAVSRTADAAADDCDGDGGGDGVSPGNNDVSGTDVVQPHTPHMLHDESGDVHLLLISRTEYKL